MPRRSNRDIADWGREVSRFFEGIGNANKPKPKPAGKPTNKSMIRAASIGQSSYNRQKSRNKPKSR